MQPSRRQRWIYCRIVCADHCYQRCLQRWCLPAFSIMLFPASMEKWMEILIAIFWHIAWHPILLVQVLLSRNLDPFSGRSCLQKIIWQAFKELSLVWLNEDIIKQGFKFETGKCSLHSWSKPVSAIAESDTVGKAMRGVQAHVEEPRQLAIPSKPAYWEWSVAPAIKYTLIATDPHMCTIH